MDLILSIVMLAAFALTAGAIYLWRRGGHQKQAGLMLVMAVVMVVNILIWTLPGADGPAPADRASDTDLSPEFPN